MNANATERPLEVSGILEVRDDVIEVSCVAGLPPGSRVRFQVPSLAPAPTTLTGKIVNLRKGPAGLVATLRLHSLSKEQRESLQRLSTAK